MYAAAIQFAPIFKSKEHNLGRLVRLGHLAAKERQLDLLVFPELCTTGYSFMSEEDARPYAETVAPDSFTFATLQRLSKEINAYVVWGMVEEDAGNQNLYNTQVCVAPDGTWVKYQKVNLWGNDFLWASEGRGNPAIIKTPFGKLGLLICRDVRDKKNSKWDSFYEKGDADVVAFSANWGRGGFPAVAWMQFVKDNHTALVVANRYGEESHNDFGHGGICTIDVQGQVSCDGLIWGQDCFVVGKV